MATLEKIRSKSVLLFVIIIVALLAFILGDFLTSGRTYFGSGTTIAKAGSAKVDYMDYQNRMNAMSEQQRNNQRNADTDDMAQTVIQQLLLEKMMQNEYDNLGIKVTNSELTEALTGPVPHPAAQQFIYQMSSTLGLPTPSGQAVYDAMRNPQKYGLPVEAAQELQKYWAAIEAEVEQALLLEKYDALLNGLYTANELDAKNAFNDVALTRHVTFAAKPLTSVPDEDVTVTDDDRRRAYNLEKEAYRLNEPLRTIDYIIVPIQPSQADRLAGNREVEDALATLRENNGTDLVAANPRFVVNTTSSAVSQMTDNRLKAFVDTASVGQAELLSNVGDNFTLVKLLGVTSEIDSINITMIGRTDAQPLDSLLEVLQGGASVADVVDGQIVLGQDSVWTSLALPGTPESVKEMLAAHSTGNFFIFSDTLQGQPVSTIYRINERHAPVPFYEVATIDYTIDPSQETLTELSANLRTFVSNNSSADEFAKNAAAAGYNIMPAAIQSTTTHIGGAPDSRPAIKWIMKAKKGQVMPVYMDNKQTYLLTAAVKDIVNSDYLPFDNEIIADYVNARALNAKKAEKLVADYAGKASDVEGYAREMGVAPITTDAMLSSSFIPGLDADDSPVMGAIAAAPVGQLVGPLAGEKNVVVFIVTGDDNANREYSFNEYANQFNRNYGIGGTRPMQDQRRFQLLLGKDKVQNSSLNFIQGHAE